MLETIGIIVFTLIFLGAIIAAFVFWIIMFIDALRNPRLEPGMRLLWLAVIFFAHIVGAAAYYFLGRNPQTIA